MHTPSSFHIQSSSARNIPRTSAIYALLRIACVVVGLGAVFLAAFLPGDEHAAWRNVVFFAGFGIIGLAWVMVYMGYRSDRSYLAQFVHALGEDNGLRIEKAAKPQYNTDFYPAIAEVGSGAKDLVIARGNIGGHDVTIYAHSYINNMIQYQRRFLVYFKVDFLTQLPHVVLQSRSKQDDPFVTAIGRTFDDNQRVSLQNDLDKYFLCYTHRRTVTDAYTLLSPQLLEQLKKLKCTMSLETVGKSAYFYLELPEADEFEVKDNLRFIDTTVASIVRTTKTDFLKLPNDAKYPFLRSRPTGGVVQFAGKYFNYAVVVLLGQYAWNMVRVFANPTSDLYPDRWWMALVGGALTIACATYLLIARSKYTRTKVKRGY